MKYNVFTLYCVVLTTHVVVGLQGRQRNLFAIERNDKKGIVCERTKTFGNVGTVGYEGETVEKPGQVVRDDLLK